MTNDLISRDVLSNWYHETLSAQTNTLGMAYVRMFWDAILNAPPVDAVEVVHARWINSSNRKYGNLDPEFRCSICEEIYWYFGVESFKFCPNCGAKMDKRRESEVSE